MSERKNALSLYRKYPLYKNYLVRKRCEALAKRTLKNAKRTGWRSFCSTINSRISPPYLWSMIKRFKKKHLDKTVSSVASNYETPTGIVQCMNAMCPSSTLDQKYFSLNDFPSNYSCTVFDSPFSSDELDTILKNLKFRSAPGLDGFDYSLISSLPKEYLSLPLNIYNGIFTEDSFPDDWHHSLVFFFIPKGSSGKYRPISLTSCFLKLMEKLISFRLTWWVEKTQLLPSRQFGFRNSKSCLDNIGILSTEIYNGFLKRHSISCVFLDIKGAFDHVIPNILISEVIGLGLPLNVCYCIYQLIYFRKNQFVINGTLSSPYYSYSGVPQDSILSLLLFNIYVAGCSAVIPRGCSIVQFMDDIAIYCSSPVLRRTLSMVEAACCRLSSFLFPRGLVVSLGTNCFFQVSHQSCTIFN